MVRFVLSSVLSSKRNIVPGGGGYHFHPRGDLLSRPLKGIQSTLAAIFRCVPTTFGNDCIEPSIVRSLQNEVLSLKFRKLNYPSPIDKVGPHYS